MLGHAYKSHGSGLAPWLAGNALLLIKFCSIVALSLGHSQLSWEWPSDSVCLLSRPWKGLERRLHGVPFQCSVLCNSWKGRAWGGGFIVSERCFLNTVASVPVPGLEFKRYSTGKSIQNTALLRSPSSTPPPRI